MRNDAPNPAALTVTGADDRAQAFRPVEGGAQLTSGETLLVEAYAAIWLILFAFVFLSWRRQRTIEGRITHLQASLDAARRAEPPTQRGP